jgi:prepilin-type N-terminal cleavage/methylation domain-containing protein
MRKGFTLIEVLVVAVIVAILAAVAIPAYNGYISSSKEKVAKNTAGAIAAAVAAYYSEQQNVTFAITLTPVVTLTSSKLVKCPENYSAAVSNSAVSVQHTDTGESASVAWR